ncbi:uncharacterized protein [Palaemon carinicauda]|uniref:uncharacterized protein n=1 Tax=Palaemon carinicauda TaxID=392227 RepID=UPI0035B6905D
MVLLPSTYALPGERSPSSHVSQASARGFGQRTVPPSDDLVPATLVTKYNVDSGNNVYDRESRSLPATLVTKYSVDSSSNVYNRESRSSLPSNLRNSSPSASLRRGTSQHPDSSNHPRSAGLSVAQTSLAVQFPSTSIRRGTSQHPDLSNHPRSAGLPVSQTSRTAQFPLTQIRKGTSQHPDLSNHPRSTGPHVPHTPQAAQFQTVPSGASFILPPFQERHLKLDDLDDDSDEHKIVHPFVHAPKGRTQSSVFFRMGNSETSYGVRHPSRSHLDSYEGKSSPAKAVVSKYNNRPPAYTFHFDVSAPKSSSHRSASSDPNFGHSETRSGSVTRGRYYVDLPDGRRQVVEYYADETGYHPKVTYV